MPDLLLVLALLSLLPGEKGQGASLLLPHHLGTPIPHPPHQCSCGRMAGQEDALAEGCQAMAALGAALEPPGVVQSLALGGTVRTHGTAMTGE